MEKFTKRIILLLAIALGFIGSVNAQTWTSTTTGGSWATAGNWTGGVPATGGNVIFLPAAGSTLTITNVPTVSLASITIGTSPTGTTGTVILQSAAGVTITLTSTTTPFRAFCNLTLGPSVSITAGAGALSATGTIAASRAFTVGANSFTWNSGGTLTCNGTMSNASGGTISFNYSGAQTLPANMTINGTLVLSSAAAGVKTWTSGISNTIGATGKLQIGGNGPATTAGIAPNYTAGASLEYTSSAAQTISTNEISLTSTAVNLIVSNTNTAGVSIGATARTFNNATFTTGCKLNLGTAVLTVNGAFSGMTSATTCIIGGATSNTNTNGLTIGGTGAAGTIWMSQTGGQTGIKNLIINRTASGTVTFGNAFDISNAGTLQILNGTVTTPASQPRFNTAGTITRVAGTISNAPNWNSATINLVYGDGTTAGDITTGNEWPASGNTIGTLTVNEPTANIVTMNTTTSQTVTGTVTLTSGRFSIAANTLTLTGDFASAGTGSFRGSATSNLTVNGTGTMTGALRFDQTSAATRTIGTYTQNRTSTGIVNLGSALDIATAFTFGTTGGLFALNNFNLSLGASATAGGSPSVTKMIVTNGTGQMIKNFATGNTSAFTFPIGDNITGGEYSPVILDYSANSVARNIGVRVVDANPPGTLVTDYLSRYWEFTDDQLANTYTLTSMDLYYNQSGDLNGTEGNILPAGWNGSTWAPYPGSITTFSDYVTVTGNESTALLNGRTITGRLTPPVYTWIATSGSGDWQVGTNWSPTRSNPTANDVLQFINGGTPTATNVPTQTISSLEISGNTTVILTPATTNTLTISDGTGADLDIVSGSSLSLSGNLTISFSSTGTPTTTIAGTLTVGSASNYDGYYAATTLTGTHNNNGTTTLYSFTTADFYNVNSGGVFVNSGTLSGFSATSFIVNNGGKFQYNLSSGTIPTATWNAGSTCEVIGAVSSIPGGMAQTFSNFTWNTSAQSASVTLNNNLNCTGTFTMANSNGTLNSLIISNFYDIICVNYAQTGGRLNMATSGTGNLLVSGTFTMSAGQINTTSSGTGLITFNGTASQNVNITGGTILGASASLPIDYLVNGTVGINMVTGSTLTVGQGATMEITRGSITQAGTGVVTYNTTASTLIYNSTTASQTATAVEFPGTNGPTNLTINNTFASGEVTFPAAITRSLSGTLTLTDGNVNLNGSTLTIGTGTGTLGAIVQTATNAGWLYGGTLTRWFTNTSITTFSPNTYPEFPIGIANARRSIFIYRPSGGSITTGGTVSVNFTNTSGLTAITPFVDGSISIDKRTNQFWTITPANGFSSTSANLGIEAFWDSAPFTISTASQLRLIQATAAVGAAGTNGGFSPDWDIQRTGLTSTALTNNFYIGSIAANLISNIQSAADGSWLTPATWNCACVPGAGDNVTILNTHDITLAAAGAVADNLAINSGGTLTLNNAAAALTIGPACGGNRELTSNGTLTINAGTITVGGNVDIASGSTFAMAGGNLVIDGNDGTSGGSVIPATSLLNVATATGTVNGGTITIVDPHFNATANGTGTGLALSYNTFTSDNWLGNTLVLGGSSCTNASTSIKGFNIDTYVGSSRLLLGNVTVNGGNSFTNRFTSAAASSSNATDIGGTLTVNANSEIRTITDGFSAAADINAGGDITNNGTITIIGSTALNLRRDASTATPTAQTISGNAITIAGEMTINNTNATGVTLSTAVTVTQSLTLTSGIVTLGSSDFTYLGTSDVGGSFNWGTSAMFVTSATSGFFRRQIPTNPFGTTYSFPIGDNVSTAEYTLADLTVSTNAIQRIIGIKVIDANHPNLNTPIASGPSSLSRYWLFSDTQSGAINYSGSLEYKDADVTGTEANIGMQNYTTSWAAVPSATISSFSNTLNFASGTTFLLGGASITGRTFPPPANDNCATATSLTQNATCSTISGTTIGATGTLGLFSGDDDDVWYTFTATAAAATIQVSSTGIFDAVLNLRDNTACSGVNMVYHEFSGSTVGANTETIRVSGLTAGQTYKLRVFSSATGSGQNTFDICVFNYTPAGNDNISGAIAASVGNTTGNSNATYGLQVNTTASGVTGVEPTGLNWFPFPNSAVNSQWFTFTPATTGCYRLAATGAVATSTFDSEIAIYTTTNVNNWNAFTEVASDEDGGPAGGFGTFTSMVNTNLTGGVTYYVQVSHFPYGSGTPTLRIQNMAVTAPVATAATGSPTCTGFTANWNAATNAASYQLDVATDAAFTSIVGSYNNLNVGNVTTYPVTGLTTGNNFYYRVRAVNPCGTATANSNVITIDNTPAQPAAFTTSSSSVCAGASGVTYTVPNDAAVTYNWSYSGTGATINGTGNSVTVDFASNATSGTLSVTASECTIASAARTIVVTITPSTVAPTFTAGATTICANDTDTYTATTTQGTVTYSIVGGTGASINPTTGVLTSAGTTDFTVRATSTNGICSSLTADRAVTVTPSTVAPTFTSGATTLCIGDIDTYTATTTQGTISYSILGGTGAVINASTGEVSSVTGSFTVVATSTNSPCGSLSTNRVVTVNPLPGIVTATAGSGATPSSITANWNAAANATSYILEVSTVSNFASTVFNSNVGNVTTFTVNSGLSASTTYFYRVTAVNACGNATVSNTITYATTAPIGGFTWVGGTSTDWNTGTNWSGGAVPSAADDITIPNQTNDPVLSTGANGACRNVTISSGATLAIGTGRTIDVKGNWVGANNTISGAGNLIFSGTSAQTITGGATVSKLQINNGSGVTVATGGNRLNITTSLDLVVGQLNTNSNLTIKSSIAGQAYIDDFSGSNAGTITGNIIVERYIPASPNGFRYIGAPVRNGATTMALSNLGGSFILSGTPGQTIPLPTCSPTFQPINVSQNSPYATFMYWQENGPYGSPACRQRGWWFQTTGNMNLGQGYGAKVGGNTVITYTGIANTGTITSTAVNTHSAIFSPSGNNGWNLVSNPFPSAIRIDETGANADPLNDMPAGYDKQMQFYITTGTNTGSYQPIQVLTGAPANIALGQGFWVRVTNPGTTPPWTLGQGHRTTGSPTYFESNAIVEDRLNVSLTGNGFGDQTDINFVDGATPGFDLFDANKWFSALGQPTLFTKVGDEFIGINSHPLLTNSVDIPMGLSPGANGTFTFTFNDVATFPQSAVITLEDFFTDSIVDIRAQGIYTFNSLATDTFNRFMLHFQPGIIADVVNQDCDNAAGSITFTQNGTTVWDSYTVTDNSNNTYAQGNNYSGAITVNNLAPQEYIITLVRGDYTAQEFITVNSNGVPIVSTLAVSDTTVLIGEQVNFTGTATNATNYSWNFGDGNTAQGSLTQQHTYAAIGEYLVTFTAFNDSCSETLSQTVYVGTVGINNQPVSNLSIYGQGEKVVIQFNNWGGNKANITMYNTLGQRVESLTGVSTIKGRQELNVAGIIPGYYFIQVVSGDKVESKKVYLGNN